MTTSRVTGAAVAVGSAALILTGCGTVHAVTTKSGPTPQQSAETTKSGVAPQQRADSDAASIVSSFVPPKGAVRLNSAPAGLSKPMGVPATPDLVDKTAYWQASGSPQAVLAWEKAHLPSRFTWAGGGTSFGGTAPAESEENFTLPPVSGVLPSRTLELTAVPDGDRTAIRIDSQARLSTGRRCSWTSPLTGDRRQGVGGWRRTIR